MDSPIKVSFRWTADEVLLLNRLHMRYSAQGRKASRSIRSGGIIFLIVGIFSLSSLALTPQKPGTFGLSFAFGLGFVLAGGFFLVGFPNLVRRAALKSYAKKPDRDLPITYEVSEERIFCKSEIASSDLIWRAIPRVLRTGYGFLLYFTDIQIHWLPLHGFQVPSDADRFAELAKAKVVDYKDER